MLWLREEKSPPKAVHVLSFSQSPARGRALASFLLMCPGQASGLGRWQALNLLLGRSLSAEISSSHSTPLLFQCEIRQISVNLQNYLFALQRVAEKRNACLVRHWSQWGNSGLLFPLNAKVHLIYLERCGVLQRHSHFRQPEVWAAIESRCSTPPFVLELLFSLLYAK